MSLVSSLLRVLNASGSEESPIESPWRNRVALIALLPLALAIAAVAVWEPWYANDGVDTLTNFEQVRSVADHGSLGFDNGPVRLYPELRTRWFVYARGQAWGIVPPVQSYLLAPAMWLGGYRGTIRAIWLLLATAALFSYALTYRITRRPALSVAAAYALVFASSLPYWATVVGPFVPAAAYGIVSLYLGSRVFDQPTRRRAWLFAAACGMFSSFTVGTHLTWTMAMALVGCVFLRFGPVRDRIENAVSYGVGAAPALALMSWVNHLRFDTWNPISYGPCSAHTCTGATNDQNVESFLGTIAPALPYAAVVVLAWFAVRRWRRATLLLVFLVPCAALLPDTETRGQIALLFRCVWGFVVDVGSLDIGHPRMSDNLGSAWEGVCVRSLLQCSPVVVAALLAGGSMEAASNATPAAPARHSQRPALWMLGLATVGSLFVLMLRARTGGPHVYGFPSVNMRYVAPLLPIVTVLAFAALSSLPWRIWHIAIAVAVAIGIESFLVTRKSDVDLLRRQVTHWLPLVIGLGLFMALAAQRTYRGVVRERTGQLAALLAACAVGYGAGLAFGIDRLVAIERRGFSTERTLELAKCAPEPRFMLLGGYAMDEALALHDHRQIYFINVGMGPHDGSGARHLIDEAMRPDYPAYLIEDQPGIPWHFRWPGFAFQPVVGCPRVQHIVRQPGPP